MTEADRATENAEPVVPPAEPVTPPSEPAAAPGEPAPGDDRPVDAEGRERPRFLLAFPSDPELQRLARAFEAGNYRAVRSGAGKLADSTEDPIVRAAARELRRRIDPDPLMKYLLCIALALFAFVVWYTYQGQPH